jgi:hypothetical protein
MRNEMDIQVLKDLALFTLPPFEFVEVYNLETRIFNVVNHFLSHSLGQVKELALN